MDQTEGRDRGRSDQMREAAMDREDAEQRLKEVFGAGSRENLIRA